MHSLVQPCGRTISVASTLQGKRTPKFDSKRLSAFHDPQYLSTTLSKHHGSSPIGRRKPIEQTNRSRVGSNQSSFCGLREKRICRHFLIELRYPFVFSRTEGRRAHPDPGDNISQSESGNQKSTAQSGSGLCRKRQAV